MAINTILEVAQASTNILTDVQYAADSSILDGVEPGAVADSELFNKTTKQATLCSAGISQYIAENQEVDIGDVLTVQQYADAFEDALTNHIDVVIGGTIITQPQFDNSQLAATDEFVNRALGSYTYSDVYTVTDDVDLEVTDIGKLIVYKPSITSQITITLPDYTQLISGTPVRLGSTIAIISTISSGSSAGVVIQPYPGQNLLTGAGADLSFTGLFQGDSIVLTFIESNGTKYWVISGGTRSLRDSNSFKSYLATDGYEYSPSGRLTQWGVAPDMGSGETRIINFTTAFPTSVFNIQATPEYNTTVSGVISAYAYPIDRFSFSLTHDVIDASVTNNVYWFATGH